MRYLKNEEPIRILFLLSLVFICYSFIFRPLSSFKFPFLALPALQLEDLFFNLSRAQKLPPAQIKDIVIVKIDNDSLRKLDQKWPWKRSVFAKLIKNINANSPKVIYLDLAFLGKSEDESQDLALKEAFQEAKNVILAGYIEDGEYVRPTDALVSSALAIGIVNKRAQTQDLKVRKMIPVVLSGRGDIVDYSVEVKLLALNLGVPFGNIRYQDGRIYLAEKLDIPLSRDGTVLINYESGISGFASVAASEILGNASAIDANIFKDKIVLIGMTANVTHDIHPTPLGPMPGVYIIANSLLMLLTGNLIHHLPNLEGMFIIFFISIMIGLLSLRLRAAYSTLLLLFVISFISITYVFLEANYNLRMDIFGLLFLTIVSFFTVQIYKYIILISESERLKNFSITDPTTGIYTQRYFQISVYSALQKPTIGQDNFFCLARINEFKQLTAKFPGAIPNILKILSAVIKKRLGRKTLIARYGEDTFSFIIWRRPKKYSRRLLELLLNDIDKCEFMYEGNNLRILVDISVVNFAQEHIKAYEDLILSAKSLFKRIGPGTNSHLVIFDPKVDKVVSSANSTELLEAMPKDELSYVSMDLEARNKELGIALDEVKKQQKKIDQIYFNTMHSLVKALEEKDQYTAGHSERVASFAIQLAQGMNLSEEELETIRKAAYLHDIGKIAIPDRILHKTEKLDDSEYELIKRHQADGIKILEGLPFFDEIAPHILYHHERYDGKGYPYGLSGDMIPRGAQIIAIADAFDAMTTGRGYNKTLMLNEAIEELRKSSGIQFNPVYVAKFIELLVEKKIHAV